MPVTRLVGDQSEAVEGFHLTSYPTTPRASASSGGSHVTLTPRGSEKVRTSCGGGGASGACVEVAPDSTHDETALRLPSEVTALTLKLYEVVEARPVITLRLVVVEVRFPHEPVPCRYSVS